MILTASEKLEIAQKIVDYYEKILKEKNATPNPEVLLIAFNAVTEKNERSYYLT